MDRYRARTRAQARALSRLDDDGVLRYREDRVLWPSARWQLITLDVPASIFRSANATAGYAALVRRINARTRPDVGDLLTDPERAQTPWSARPGQAITIAWLVDPMVGSSAHPWGPGRDAPQRFLGRSAVR